MKLFPFTHFCKKPSTATRNAPFGRANANVITLLQVFQTFGMGGFFQPPCTRLVNKSSYTPYSLLPEPYPPMLVWSSTSVNYHPNLGRLKMIVLSE